MLRRAAVFTPRSTHEDVFVDRYERLLNWAHQLAHYDHAEAEDLLHDTFVQFTIAQPDLGSIHNLDGYLYGTLRNTHLSRIRKASRARLRQLSIFEYDSAEAGLQSVDPRNLIEVQDELRRLCHFVCLRKEMTRSASVLILRFFHGYYPSEIAQILRTTPQAVKVRLRMARLDVKACLENTHPLGPIADRGNVQVLSTGIARSSEDLLTELRETIFQARQNDCLSKVQMRKLYRSSNDGSVDTRSLGHFVSCLTCLEEINKVLGLPSLADRYPTDSIGRDKNRKSGSGGGKPPGPPSLPNSKIEKWRRHAREVFEHDPEELFVSINGYMQGSHRIGSDLNDFALDIDMAEPISFVEVLSEQQVRMALMNCDDPPPEGSGEQSLQVQLSDQRTLDLQLRFGSPRPTLRVVYHDSGLKQREALIHEAAEEERNDTHTEFENKNKVVSAPSLPVYIPGNLLRLWRRVSFHGFWLRPATVTIVITALLAAMLLYVRLPVRRASAAELIRNSIAAEEAAGKDSKLAQHRTVHLEERRGSAGVRSRSRIEIWKSPVRGVNVRRVYDESNKLVAGEWANADGTSTIYRRGEPPQLRTAAEVAPRALLETGELWRLDASAKMFSVFVDSKDVTVDRRGGAFILTYQNNEPVGTVRVLHASLTVSSSDFHVGQETLTVERNGETSEYIFVELGYEKLDANTIAPSIFEPEPELLGSFTEGVGKSEKSITAVSKTVKSEGDVSVVASRELEIEVSYLLNQIKANLGEQVTLSRTTTGKLTVEALAETEQRKAEILNALRPVINNPAVVIDVQTVTEALKRRPQGKAANAGTVEEVEIPTGRAPLDSELRKFFSTRVAAAEIEGEISRYSNQVMNHSRQALLHASALASLVKKFSPQEARALEPQARGKLLSMIREQAQLHRRATELLRQELGRVFPELTADEAASQMVNEANLLQSGRRLLQLNYANDEAVRSSFTINSGGRNSAGIKQAQFWRSLNAAESLSASIQALYQK